jgi:hypothetical protein
LALNESFIDDQLVRDICEFTPLPRLYLFPHRVKVALHPVNPEGNAVDQKKRLRMFGEYERKHACDNISDF